MSRKYLRLGPSTGSPEIVREYQRKWVLRKRRTNPGYAERQRRYAKAYNREHYDSVLAYERYKAWIAMPGKREQRKKSQQEWRRKKRRCFFCGKLPRFRQVVAKVERFVPINGELKLRQVFWCKTC